MDNDLPGIDGIPFTMQLDRGSFPTFTYEFTAEGQENTKVLAGDMICSPGPPMRIAMVLEVVGDRIYCDYINEVDMVFSENDKEQIEWVGNYWKICSTSA